MGGHARSSPAPAPGRRPPVPVSDRIRRFSQRPATRPGSSGAVSPPGCSPCTQHCSLVELYFSTPERLNRVAGDTSAPRSPAAPSTDCPGSQVQPPSYPGTGPAARLPRPWGDRGECGESLRRLPPRFPTSRSRLRTSCGLGSAQVTKAQTNPRTGVADDDVLEKGRVGQRGPLRRRSSG